MDHIESKNWLSTLDVIDKVKEALNENKPLSLVRVGDGENICLTQYEVWPISKTLSTEWAVMSRKTPLKGVRLPNVDLRDQLIASIKKADIVGIPHYNDTEIKAKQELLRPLTDACFEKYNIHPKQLCHTFVNRHMVEYKQFWEMLRGKRVVFISKWAENFRQLVNQEYNEFEIDFVKAIKMEHFEYIPKIIKKMKPIHCDIVFVSAGVSAVILAQKLAEEQGRIAIDFGKSAAFMINGNPSVHPWKP